MIDEDGQLMVNKTRAIDADVPPTTHLEYYIYATDCKENQLPSEICFTTSEEVSQDLFVFHSIKTNNISIFVSKSDHQNQHH